MRGGCAFFFLTLLVPGGKGGVEGQPDLAASSGRGCRNCSHWTVAAQEKR